MLGPASLSFKLNTSLVSLFIPRINDVNITENIPIKLRDPLIRQALQTMNQEEIDVDVDSDLNIDNNIKFFLTTIFRFATMLKMMIHMLFVETYVPT